MKNRIEERCRSFNSRFQLFALRLSGFSHYAFPALFHRSFSCPPFRPVFCHFVKTSALGSCGKEQVLQFTECQTHALWQIINCRPVFLGEETQICLFPILSFLKFKDFYRFQIGTAKAIENGTRNSGIIRHNKVMQWNKQKQQPEKKALKRVG